MARNHLMKFKAKQNQLQSARPHKKQPVVGEIRELKQADECDEKKSSYWRNDNWKTTRNSLLSQIIRCNLRAFLKSVAVLLHGWLNNFNNRDLYLKLFRTHFFYCDYSLTVCVACMQKGTTVQIKKKNMNIYYMSLKPT